jgi:hypothetical protein
MAVFFLTMNLFSGVVMSSGVGAMIGVETTVGGDEKVNKSVQNAGEVRSGAPTGSTLFGMYNVLADGLNTLALPVTAGPDMLKRAGVPGLVTDAMLKPIIAIIYALGIISFMRGWGL